MHIQLEFPLGTLVRTRHPFQQTRQEGTVMGYWEDAHGLYVRFDGAPEEYSFPASYARDPQCLTLLRRGTGRVGRKHA